MREAAKVELVSRASLFGQARLRAHFTFETETCTVCGSKLIDRCGRCRARFFEPVEDRCRACGLPQPWSPERLLSSTRARARHWKEGESKDPATFVCRVGEVGALYVIEGDITSIAVDCILSNDDVDGRMYTVIASAIKAAAGADVERESLAQGPFRRGEAWRTDAGTLPAPIQAVVHVAAMDRRGDTERETIRECVSGALDEARGMSSIGIAAFGTGPPGFGPKVIDIEDWLGDVAETVVARFVEWHRGAPTEVIARTNGEATPAERPTSSGAHAAIESEAEPEARKKAPPLDVLIVLYEPSRFDLLVERITAAAKAVVPLDEVVAGDKRTAPEGTNRRGAGKPEADLPEARSI